MGTSSLSLYPKTPKATCQKEFQLSVNNLRGEQRNGVDVSLAPSVDRGFRDPSFGGGLDGRKFGSWVVGRILIRSISERGSV